MNYEKDDNWQNRFGRNLESIRKARHKSVKEFAIELGIPKSTLHPIIKNGNTSLNTAVQISNALDKPLDDLINGDFMLGETRLSKSAKELISAFENLSAEEQETAIYHITELLKMKRGKQNEKSNSHNKCSCGNRSLFTGQPCRKYSLCIGAAAA